MAYDTWSRERIHKITGTEFSPAGYDYYGFNAEGLNRHGYDKDGFNKDGLDRNGNRRGNGLKGYETRLLTSLAYWKGGDFRKTDVIPGFYPDGDKSSRDWHFGHKDAFESLVAKGIIVKSGRRWNLSDEGSALLSKVLADKADA